MKFLGISSIGFWGWLRGCSAAGFPDWRELDVDANGAGKLNRHRKMQLEPSQIGRTSQ